MAEKRAPGGPMALTSTLNEDALTTERVSVAGADDADRVLGEWFEHRFVSMFQHDGHWEPYGDILIEPTREGLEISIDGQAVGATSSGDTRITEVRGGPRQLVLVGPGIERYSTTIDVVRGDVVRLSPDLSATGGAGFRSAVLWGGAAVGVAGVVTTIIGVAGHDGSVLTTCFQGPGCVAGPAFETSGFDASQAGTLRSPNGSGVYIVPLGLGLLGAGASWSLGSDLSDETSTPWLPLLIGTSVGVLTYVLGATLSVRPEGS